MHVFRFHVDIPLESTVLHKSLEFLYPYLFIYATLFSIMNKFEFKNK